MIGSYAHAKKPELIEHGFIVLMVGFAGSCVWIFGCFLLTLFAFNGICPLWLFLVGAVGALIGVLGSFDYSLRMIDKAYE